MDNLIPESPLKRQSDIAKCLREFILDDIADIISSYDYHLEGVHKSLKGLVILGVLSDGRILCQNSFDNYKVWNIDSKNNNYDVMFGHNEGNNCYEELPNNLIAIGYLSGIICIYYIGMSENTLGFSFYGKECRSPCIHIMGYDRYRVHCIEYISDDLMVGAGDGIKIWNIKCDDLLQQKAITEPYLVLEEPSDSYVTVICVLSNQRIASGYADSEIKIWNITNCECEFIMRGHKGMVSKIVPMYDNYIVSWCYDDGLTKIWNINKNNKKETEVKADYTIVDCHPIIYGDKRYRHSKVKSKIFVEKFIRIKSLSYDDNTIKLFDHKKNLDFENNELKQTLEPITTDIILSNNFSFYSHALILPNDQVVGCGGRGSGGLVKIWNPNGDEDKVFQNCCEFRFWLLSDGRIISKSIDGIKIWH